MQMKAMMKGIGVGVIAGAILTAAVVPVDTRRLRRSKPVKALKTIGQMMEGITETFS